jgi:hypothetical protein
MTSYLIYDLATEELLAHDQDLGSAFATADALAETIAAAVCARTSTGGHGHDAVRVAVHEARTGRLLGVRCATVRA